MANSKEPGARHNRAHAANGDILGVNSEIGRKLKRYYEGLVAESVPDRFADLLSQLEKTEDAHNARASKKA